MTAVALRQDDTYAILRRFNLLPARYTGKQITFEFEHLGPSRPFEHVHPGEAEALGRKVGDTIRFAVLLSGEPPLSVDLYASGEIAGASHEDPRDPP